MRLFFKSALAMLIVVAASELTASAAPIVNAAQPITKHIEVQLIQTALDNGSSPATAFGNPTQRAVIESEINQIWAQAGMDVIFLPTITRYNNTFAYQGTAGGGVRPQSDLSTIVNNANAAGLLNSDLQVIDMFLLNVVPAFSPLGEGTAAGLSYIDGNGVSGYVGDNLLTFSQGIDAIASVFAHEIGHNLGLFHTAVGGPNLMSPNNSTQQLDASQIATARASIFARAFAVPVAGDYNHDGQVNSVDYTIWRNSLNQAGASLAADGNGNGRIDSGDYAIWRSSFGNRVGSGAGLLDFNGAVPEPSLSYAMFLLCFTARRRR